MAGIRFTKHGMETVAKDIISIFRHWRAFPGFPLESFLFGELGGDLSLSLMRREEERPAPRPRKKGRGVIRALAPPSSTSDRSPHRTSLLPSQWTWEEEENRIRKCLESNRHVMSLSRPLPLLLLFLVPAQGTSVGGAKQVPAKMLLLLA